MTRDFLRQIATLFSLSKVENVFLTFTSFRKQYTTLNRSRHYLNIGKLLRLNAHLFKPSLLLVFISIFWSLICIWTLPQIFSCEGCVLQLFCHKAEAAYDILSVVKNNWDGDFSNFIDLYEKKQVWQILSNFTKVPDFIPCNYI